MTVLPRLQLFEWMDQPWFPAGLRRYQTDLLVTIWQRLAHREGVAEQLADLVDGTPSRRIVDLCSGSGGLVTSLYDGVKGRSGGDLEIVLTDVYPNTDAELGGGMSYWPDPVDARKLDDGLPGVRTMFAGFHHFEPAQAQEILASAIRARQPIAIYEMTPRSFRTLFLTSVNSVMGTALFTPLVRPFSWVRLLFTYVIPLVSMFMLFDGIVSALRTYTEDEMLRMAEAAGGSGYEWNSGVLTNGPARLQYFWGRPRP